MATLYSIHHSPWSERARWALDHHRIAFEERTHVPLVGELALRWRAGSWGKVSVPLWVDDDGTATQGSLAIAEHVDAIGKGATLFPEGARDRIRGLYDDLEDALRAARARHVKRLGSDREGQFEALPPFLRRMPFATTSAKLGASFIASKYDARDERVDERMRAGLQLVREALAGRAWVLGSFSFADVLGASVVQTITPVSDEYLALPAATRRLWTHEELGDDFRDLVAWRDALYAKHRRA
jgi:glutathione S-transferase